MITAREVLSEEREGWASERAAVWVRAVKVLETVTEWVRVEWVAAVVPVGPAALHGRPERATHGRGPSTTA